MATNAHRLSTHIHHSSNNTTNTARTENPVLLICDLQEKFRPAISHFPSVLSTAQKLLRASSILHIPILATTQTRQKLGSTCPELELGTTYPLAADIDKTAFSMWVPELRKALERLPRRDVDVNKDSSTKRGPFDVILVGIETHICVLQTTLDALAAGHRVWVVQDGVSSCNAEERPVALARMRQEGAKVTTSESLLYEMVGDAGDPVFKQIISIVKETKESTAEGLKALAAL
ncbi:MAG: hypothetical protein Q9162_007960 [Coniocarpon cinnabarinum]